MISRNMLYMSVRVSEVVGTSADRKPVYGEPVTVDGVWFDNQTAQTDGTNGKTPASSGILYYDVAVSRPRNVVFKKNMRVEYNGENFTVNDVKECRTASGVSHYEIRVN